jgi:hypothetical protein
MLSILLLAAAGVLAQTQLRLLTESPGFNPRGVAIVSIDTRKIPRKGVFFRRAGAAADGGWTL